MERSELDQVKKGVAVVAAAIATALDPEARRRLVAAIEDGYYRLKNEPDVGRDALETVSWARELITGWNPVSGQGKPYISPEG